MNKRKFGRKLGRGQGARKALFRSITKALVEHGSITTTKAKAKAFQGEIDKLVGLAKEGSIVSRRRVYAKLGNDRVTTDKIFQVVAKVFKDREGGYTRTINLPLRRGDNAETVRLEWTEEIGEGSAGRTGRASRTGRKGKEEPSKKPVAKKALSRLRPGKKKAVTNQRKSAKKSV